MSDDALATHDGLPGLPLPSQNTEVFGHDEQAAFLARTWASGRIHHAWLFDGPAGIGKATLAFKFARHVISNPDPSKAPLRFVDTDTQLAHQIAIGAHAQVLHLTRPFDEKSNKFKTQLTVDETRKINHFLAMTIPGDGWRIVIVDPVNDMNANAANSLLKNLEEPTPRTLFILISQSAGRLLPTIRSRCLQLRFLPLGQQAMEKALEALGIGEAGHRDEIVRHAGGSPRMAAMLAEGGALEIMGAADAILAHASFDPQAALKIGEALNSRDAEPLFVLLNDYLAKRVADVALQAARAGTGQGVAVSEFYADFSQRLAVARGYNLDKRQFILEAMREIHEMLRSSAV